MTAISDSALSPSRPTEAIERLIDLYTTWDNPDQTAKWRKELDERKYAEVRSIDTTEKP